LSRTLHSFVIPAFGDSPFLEECLASLASQQLRSPVTVSTSTPSPGLLSRVERHHARLHVHAPNRGIGADWNAAIDQADSHWATIAHQDDVYDSQYTARMLQAVENFPDTSIAFCAADEIREGVRSVTTHMRVKRALTEFAFLGRQSICGTRAKRRLLCLGNPIVCPSVMINLRKLGGLRFDETFRSNLDWAAWLELAVREGRFRYVRETLVAQRTHAEAETTSAIACGIRRAEDRHMFSSIWPGPVAAIISRTYELGYRNRIEANRQNRLT